MDLKDEESDLLMMMIKRRRGALNQVKTSANRVSTAFSLIIMFSVFTFFSTDDSRTVLLPTIVC